MLCERCQLNSCSFYVFRDELDPVDAAALKEAVAVSRGAADEAAEAAHVAKTASRWAAEVCCCIVCLSRITRSA